MARRPSPERGASESLQWALLTPVLLLCILGLVQAGVVLHARNTVRHAAMAAAEAQALAGAREQDAAAVVHRMTQRSDVRQVVTTVHRVDGTVTVTVQGKVPLLLGVGSMDAAATATMPLEVP